MAIDVWVSAADHQVRVVTMEPGQALEVVPQDRLKLEDVELDAVRLLRSGDDLVIRLETGFE